MARAEFEPRLFAIRVRQGSAEAEPKIMQAEFSAAGLTIFGKARDLVLGPGTRMRAVSETGLEVKDDTHGEWFLTLSKDAPSADEIVSYIRNDIPPDTAPTQPKKRKPKPTESAGPGTLTLLLGASPILLAGVMYFLNVRLLAWIALGATLVGMILARVLPYTMRMASVGGFAGATFVGLIGAMLLGIGVVKEPDEARGPVRVERPGVPFRQGPAVVTNRPPVEGPLPVTRPPVLQAGLRAIHEWAIPMELDITPKIPRLAQSWDGTRLAYANESGLVLLLDPNHKTTIARFNVRPPGSVEPAPANVVFSPDESQFLAWSEAAKTIELHSSVDGKLLRHFRLDEQDRPLGRIWPVFHSTGGYLLIVRNGGLSLLSLGTGRTAILEPEGNDVRFARFGVGREVFMYVRPAVPQNASGPSFRQELDCTGLKPKRVARVPWWPFDPPEQFNGMHQYGRFAFLSKDSNGFQTTNELGKIGYSGFQTSGPSAEKFVAVTSDLQGLAFFLVNQEGLLTTRLSNGSPISPRAKHDLKEAGRPIPVAAAILCAPNNAYLTYADQTAICLYPTKAICDGSLIREVAPTKIASDVVPSWLKELDVPQRVVNVAELQPVQRWALPTTPGEYIKLQLSSDGSRVISNSNTGMRLFDATHEKAVLQLPDRTAETTGLGLAAPVQGLFTSDAARFLTFSDHQNEARYALHQSIDGVPHGESDVRLTASSRSRFAIDPVVLLPDGKRFVHSFRGRLFAGQFGEKGIHAIDLRDTGEPITDTISAKCVGWLADGTLLMTSCKPGNSDTPCQHFFRLDSVTGQPVDAGFRIRADDFALSMYISGDRQKLLYRDAFTGIVEVVSLPEGKLLLSCKLPENENAQDYRFTPDSTGVFTLTNTKVLHQWDIESGKRIAKLELNPIVGDEPPKPGIKQRIDPPAPASGITLSADGKRIAIANAKNLWLFNTADLLGKELAPAVPLANPPKFEWVKLDAGVVTKPPEPKIVPKVPPKEPVVVVPPKTVEPMPPVVVVKPSDLPEVMDSVLPAQTKLPLADWTIPGVVAPKTGSVRIALDPTGRRLLLSDASGDVCLVDPIAKKLVRRFSAADPALPKGITVAPAQFAFAPDGATFIAWCVSNASLTIRGTTDGEVVRKMTWEELAKGSRLAANAKPSYAADGSLLVPLAPGVVVFPGKTGVVRLIPTDGGFSPIARFVTGDSLLLAKHLKDDPKPGWQFYTLDRTTRKVTPERLIEGFASALDGIVIAPDAAWIARPTETAIEVLPRVGGEPLECKSTNASSTDGFTFTPDGTGLLDIGSTGQVGRWDLAGRKRIGAVEVTGLAERPEKGWAIAPSADGKLLAVAREGRIRLWRTADLFGADLPAAGALAVGGAPLPTIGKNDPTPVVGVKIAPVAPQQQMTTEAPLPAQTKTSVKSWIDESVAAHPVSLTTTVVYSPTGKRLVVADGSGDAALCDPIEGNVLLRFPIYNAEKPPGAYNFPPRATFSPDGSMFVTWDLRCDAVELRNAEDGIVLHRLSWAEAVPKTRLTPGATLRFSPDGGTLIVPLPGKSMLFDVKMGNGRPFTLTGVVPTLLETLPDGNLLGLRLTIANGKPLYDLQPLEPSTRKNVGEPTRIPSILTSSVGKLSPNGRFWAMDALVNGQAMPTVFDISAATANLSCPTAFRQASTGYDFTSDSKNLVVIGEYGQVSVWNIVDRKRSVTTDASAVPVMQRGRGGWAIALAPDGKTVAVARGMRVTTWNSMDLFGADFPSAAEYQPKPIPAWLKEEAPK